MASAAVAAPDAAIVVDAKSGKVLYADNPDAVRHPASLTKMMTLYLLFDAIESGRTSLDSQITISVHAANQAPSKLGLKPGETISVRDAILAIVTKSANDIAVAIAEHLGGTEQHFAELMTRRAHQLGMTRTTFVNASGLPNNGQITTARDLATLGRALREHYPQYYSFFSTPSFVWRGRRIANHDHLLGRVDGVNGIKTGYTRASGFNLVTSVDRGNRKIVAVVLGGETGRQRDQRMASLVDTYMPLATRGARTAQAIPGGPAPDPATSVAANTQPPPRLRPTETAGATETADAATGSTDGTTDADASAAPATTATAVADLASVAAPGTDADEGDAAGDEGADAAPSAVLPSGWRIQISAAPSQSSAEDLLDRALAAGGKVLDNAAPYTEPVQSGSTTLYRARFAGFASRDAARSACAYLVKQAFSCLAVAN